MPDQNRILSYLPWLRTFEAAARRMNFSEAARELGLSQAAVSQQIKLLEQEFGEPLFERQRRGVTITAAGAAFLPHVQSAFGTLARSSGELFGKAANRRIILHSPISFTSLWLAPRLKALSQDLPHISLDIKTVHLPADYKSEDNNLHIRYGIGYFSGRNALRLTKEYLVPVVSAATLRHSTSAAVWKSMPLLSVSGGREMWADWFDEADMQIPAPPVHRFDTFVAALSAAKAGAGILLGSRPLIDHEINSGELAEISDIQYVSDNGHFLTYEADIPLNQTEQSLLRWFKQNSINNI
ncbi:hypothetical protein A9Q83_05315 [Alphaproteobacteria bacterium 46_93_T64]|nr:hypothetical protein A9Q83_05315 [Alphaproteobacteria bacterium 46_93_T64]